MEFRAASRLPQAPAREGRKPVVCRTHNIWEPLPRLLENPGKPRTRGSGVLSLSAYATIWHRPLVPAIPFNTLYTLFARWTRLGLWRRLLDRLCRTWRLACGDTADPGTVVIDSRSCRSAPSGFTRGIDGGKKIRGVKIQVDKHGIPLAIDVAP